MSQLSLVQLLILLRPHQWVKNGLVVLPILFARKIGEPAAWQNIGLALAAFCLVSSVAYIVNDVRDRESDRFHPEKKHRPVASGRIAPLPALGVAGLLLILAGVLAMTVSTLLLMVVGMYLALQVAYTLALKRVVLLDVICIAAGFVLRADAGAVAIEVPISPWLVGCTFTICLFMGFCKRFGELTAIDNPEAAARHRAVLAGYSLPLLQQLIAISAAVSVMSYLAYTVSYSTLERLETDLMVYTMPMVCYAVFRFAMLFLAGRYHDPSSLVLRDRPFQAAGLIWLVVAAVVVMWGPAIEDWFSGASLLSDGPDARTE